MSRIRLATRSEEFNERLRAGLADDVDAIAMWPAGFGTGDLDHAVAELAADTPEVVVIGPGVDIDTALLIAEKFDLDHPAISVVLVADATTGTLERALHSGARGVLAPNASPEEIAAVLKKAVAVSRRRRELTGPADDSRPTNRVISVLAAKGGSGKTTLASNLAVSLAAMYPGDVVVVDLDLQFGDIGSAFGVTPEYTIADTIPYNESLDMTTLKAFLTPNQAAGLYILAAPDSPAQADELRPDHVARILRLLSQDFPYVVVDTAAGIDEFTLESLDVATDLVLLTSMDVPSIRATSKEIDALHLLGMERLPWHMVLNRATAKVGLTIDDIEMTLGRPIDVRIPSTRAVPLSVNRGEPLALRDSRSVASRAYAELARRTAGAPAESSGWLRKRREA